MRVFSRQTWTGLIPQSNTGAEDTPGTPNYRASELQGIKIFKPEVYARFVDRDPHKYFQTLLKTDFQLNGYGDIQYNLGVAPNVNGIFILRGLCSKSAAGNKEERSKYISILALCGEEERPTDQLLYNLIQARTLVLGKYPAAKEILSLLPVGNFWDLELPRETNQFQCALPTSYTCGNDVQTFDLIEALAYWNYYKGRNDGIYGNITRQSVMELQADLAESRLYLKRVDGLYGRYTREAFCLFLRQLQE